jgi:protein SCO1/2
MAVVLTTRNKVWITVGAVLLFMALVVMSFVHRIQQPRVMTTAEMQVNGLYLFETPRDLGQFALQSHRGKPFTASDLQGRWTMIFFGFTHCPDVCPTTLAFLSQLMTQLESTEVDDTAVVMVSVDPARDTAAVLQDYVPYFNPEFTGVTGEFVDILKFARTFNAPFRKVTAEDGSYQVDHSANIVLVNPRGHYHGFFKAPLDLAKMKVTYRSARYLWEN